MNEIVFYKILYYNYELQPQYLYLIDICINSNISTYLVALSNTVHNEIIVIIKNHFIQ